MHLEREIRRLNGVIREKDKDIEMLQSKNELEVQMKDLRVENSDYIEAIMLQNFPSLWRTYFSQDSSGKKFISYPTYQHYKNQIHDPIIIFELRILLIFHNIVIIINLTIFSRREFEETYSIQKLSFRQQISQAIPSIDFYNSKDTI
ncbi:32441_t:CDS:2 [Gigaspora margarita]|uniref:32441_t:CDS:1 n=1 Tax=Gigaspora margarita TaxID=4874 RepID=A0ABN7VPM8_GIGMA|nr:32441_t:CDS:2 [Gigaspora margarita]